jgi:phosphoserine phosphatase
MQLSFDAAASTPPSTPARAARLGPAFASLALDVESTITGIEGINWLAARRDPSVAREIADLTEQAMRGEIAFEQVYARRLECVRPTEAEIVELGELYLRNLAPGAIEAIDRLRAAGVRIVLISGGIRQALTPIASMLGFTPAELCAVRVSFDQAGAYAGFDDRSPLTTSDGKGTVLQRLYLPRALLAVGDGATDLAMRSAADAFVAFTGFVRRPAIARAADHEVDSFAELRSLIIG